MKKVLLSTTALVAAGMMAGAAQAQEEMMEEPISLGLGGYYRAAVGFVSGDLADNKHSPGLQQNIEFTASGSTTLDNGLTAGVKVQINGNNTIGGDTADDPSTTGVNESMTVDDFVNDMNVDETFVFLRHGFGQVRLGFTESASQEMTNFAPGGASNFGVDTPFHNFVGKPVATYNDGLGNEDSLKVVYFSPNFNGFRFGMSYAPDDSEANYPANADNDEGLSNQWSIAAEYSTDVDDLSFRTMIGYESYGKEDNGTTPCDATNAEANCEPEALRFGATVGSAGMAFGGSMLITDQSNQHEQTEFALGASYSDGPWTLGLQWGHSETEKVMGDNTTDMYAFNGTYTLGPGISLQGQVDMGAEEAPMTADKDWTQFMLGTAITF